MPIGYYSNTKDEKVVLCEMRKCVFRKKLHDKKLKDKYFRCTKDGSIRKDKSCYKCYNYVPSLWQKFKNWFDRHFY